MRSLSFLLILLVSCDSDPAKPAEGPLGLHVGDRLGDTIEVVAFGADWIEIMTGDGKRVRRDVVGLVLPDVRCPHR